MPDVRMIQQAVRYLANRCDGAISEDGHGFNKMDASFGKSLAERERWTKRQAQVALEMLKKYEGQLQAGGFDVEKLFDGSEITYPHLQQEKTKQMNVVKKVDDKTMEIRFKFDQELLQLIKSLPGRRFHPDKKYWTATITTDSINKLKDAGFVIDAELEKLLHQAEEQAEEMKKGIEVPELKKQLFPFQKQGVAFIEKRDGRALIADEMGLGKTIQATAWLQLHPEKRPAIILCPASLKLNWAKELKNTLSTNDKVEILSGVLPYSVTGDIVIINYDILNSWVETLQAINPKVIIMDECFPAGTKIMTPKGEKNIEDLKPGDEVYNAIGIGRIKRVGKRISKTVILHLSNGKRIEVTPNHPFFTDIGWVQAKDLTGRILFTSSQIYNIIRSDNISKNMKEEEVNEKNQEELRMVRKDIYPQVIIQAKILRDILLSEVENEFTRNQNEVEEPGKEQKNLSKSERGSFEESGMGKNNFFTDERKQSYEEPRNDRENEENIKGNGILSESVNRREREAITDSSTYSMGCTGSRMENRISDKNQNAQRFWIPDVLQSRYSPSERENMDRSGRMESRTAGCENARQKEGGIFENIRVERVEIQKRGSGKQPSGSVVYNLEVSGHPSYYAEGFLVHNCHYIKNSSAIRTKSAKKLAKGIPHVIALTGTPIVNRPVEGFNIFQILDKNLFPNFWTYVHRYCGARHNGFGWDFSGATNKEELNQILTSTIMIRRRKADVLKDLPEKLYSFVPMELDNKKEYSTAELEFIEYLQQIKGKEAAEKAKKAEHLVKIEAMKQLAVKGKLKQAINWIKDFIEDGSKLVVFAVHKEVIDQLMKEFKEIAVKIDGSTPIPERHKAVEAFQSDPNIKLFIGNIQAAGVGLTLTAASAVAFLELPWTPGELQQAEDRCHRIGQKNAVNIYYLLAENSVEYKLAKLLDKKKEVLSAVIDGNVVDEKSLITELIESYLEGKEAAEKNDG